MSKLDELIRKFCPDGIKFEFLDACCTLEKGQTPIQKASAGKYPLVVTTNERKSSDSYQFDKPTVCVPLVSSRGHGVASLNSLYYQEGKFALGNILCGITPINGDQLSAKFLYYYLNHKKDKLIVTLMRGGANVSLTVSALKKVKIPVPPIEIQSEIERIFDTFEALLAKLTAELTARRKQYEHYRDELMSTAKELREVSFDDLFDFQNGFAFKSTLFKDTGSPIIRITNIQDQHIDTSGLVYFSLKDYKEKLDQFIVYPGDIVVAMSGATTGKIGINDTNTCFYLNQRVGKFIPKEKIILTQYLYHLLLRNSNRLLEISSGSGAQPNLSSEKLKKLKDKIPPISEQQRILALLERFNTLNTNLVSGLPAEIAARQKQYEYYRDKLLSFKELEA